MNHFYGDIQGWFTFPEYYRRIADIAARASCRAGPGRRGWRGVEVGCYQGTSAAFLGVEILNRICDDTHHDVRLDLVDTFQASDMKAPEVTSVLSPIAQVLGDVRTGLSWEIAARYADKSLDFVFLDADHHYESIRKDIDAWLPKVKRGGIIAGHDFSPEFEGVIRAVIETFQSWSVYRGDLGDMTRDPTMAGRYFPCWEVQL